MGLDMNTLGAARAYTKATAEAMGAVKGANCTISDISVITGGHRITFAWKDNQDVTHTSTLDVMDGAEGNGIHVAYVVGSTPYASDWLSYTPSGAPFTPDPDDIYVIASSGTYLNTMYRWDGTAYACISGEGGSSALTSDLTVSVTVGGITSGTTLASGTSLEQIFRDMLNPVAYPTLTNPSATLSATSAKLLEKGGTLSTTFTASFNRGSINPAYGTSGYRSGTATGYSLNGGTSQVGNTWSATVTESQLTYQASVSYAAGEQPKDSVGNDYSTPLPAGSVNSNTITYEFVDAMWANTAAIATIAKLSLVSKSTKQRDMTFPAQTVANPEVFDIPASWTVTAVQVKNDLSGAWEDAASQFTVTDTTHDNAGGVSTNYKRYTFNMGVDTGSRQIRVKWS